MIILPCPKRPDLDCIAGAYAYAEYLRAKGQEARVWIGGPPDGEAVFHLNRFKDGLPDAKFATDDDIKQATAFIAIDYSVNFILPETIDPAKYIQVIDHRHFTTPEKDFPNAKVQIDLLGAAATQVTEYFMRDNLAPSIPSAEMLYGAIYTHTLCLQSTTVTDRDRAAIAWLKEFVPDADTLITEQLQARADEIITQMPGILDTEMKMEQCRFGRFGIVLLELTGAQNFWDARCNDIITWAATKDFPVIVDIIDPMENKSIVYSNTPEYTAVLETGLAVAATDQVFHLQPAWFRKQIIPLLK